MVKGEGIVLVTGATGKQGGAIAHELLAAGWLVRAMTRRPDSPEARQLREHGAEVVQADLDDDASVRQALDGAWGAVAVQNTWEAGVEREEQQGKRFAKLARDAGIQHLLYQSVGSAHRNTGIPHFDNKWRVEQTIRELAFPSWTVLRPVFFMENLLGPFFLPSIQQGKFAIALRPETRLQMIAVRDIGSYGLRAFERHEDLNGRAIDIAGDELTGPEVAAILTELTDRDIIFESTPIAQVRAASEEYAVMLEWFDAVGYEADIEGTARELDVKPTRFREWAQEQSWS